MVKRMPPAPLIRAALLAARSRPLSEAAIETILAAYATPPHRRSSQQAAIVDLIDRARRRRAGVDPWPERQ